MTFLTLAFLAACTGGSQPAPPPATTDSADTAAAAPTGDTAVPMVEVKFAIWEEDRQCWGVTTWEKPASHWAAWDDLTTTCLSASDGIWSTYATSDGLCIGKRGYYLNNEPSKAHCDVDDPWLRDCSEVAGCCAFNDTVVDTGGTNPITLCDPIEYQP